MWRPSPPTRSAASSSGWRRPGSTAKGDPDILIVVDAGYHTPRLAYLLADLPVEVLGRLRSDRVLRRPAPPRRYAPKGGRPPRHGGEFRFTDPHPLAPAGHHHHTHRPLRHRDRHRLGPAAPPPHPPRRLARPPRRPYPSWRTP
ncbi:transposase [Carbonactinospora thermoautotrophica]|uniref:transposase n=1 Tax=Carbonactinospora thermoautotrophica TaxID=1469144 RepID=UPI001FD02E03|nr:transposase [Carbonactinospora thermoautotrophica]